MSFSCILVAAALGASAADSQALPHRVLAFGPERGGWMLLDVATRRMERIRLPVPNIDAIGISNDGQRIAYVAPAPVGQGIWLWDRDGTSTPRLIESGTGKYSDPVVAPDGWIYFARSPVNARPHAFGTYAQVFRVREDGSSLQQITDENGCHFGLSLSRNGRLQYVHSSCSTESWVERKSVTAAPEILVSVASSLTETAVSPDGRAVLFVEEQPDSFVINERRTDGRQHAVAVLNRRMKRVRAAYGRTRAEIFYQQDGRVWLLAHGGRTLVGAIESEASQ